ncbi:MAG: DUF393 domain-containing protein [Bacteroidetes bacterium]|nr:DUF393 domain-containing protein [Bacteroidota bacterium]
MQDQYRKIENPIILFDGICNLCNSSVQWIIKKDKKTSFRFASIQSKAGISLLSECGLTKNQLYSIVLIENNSYRDKSDAIIQICVLIGGIWKLAKIFLIIPKVVRDLLYDYIAKNRYKWFGKRKTCMLPNEDVLSLFL